MSAAAGRFDHSRQGPQRPDRPPYNRRLGCGEGFPEGGAASVSVE